MVESQEMTHSNSGLRQLALTSAFVVLTLAPQTTLFAQSDPCKGVSDSGTAYSNPALFAQRKVEWLACIDSVPSNVDVIEQAADFVAILDPVLAQNLYEKARAIEPNNPHWTQKLAQLHGRNTLRS